MSKYYTPNITEFRIGFDYEVKYKEGEWKKQCLNDELASLRFIDFKLKTNPDDIRVKYLDKEDIESLGFKQSSLTINIFLYKDKISILPHLPKTTIGINFNEGRNHLVIFNIPDENIIPAGVNLFVGNIKNKSELKILLKQLNIL